MTQPVTTAMVLAAGLGTRMRPLTNDRPKALVEVNGRALIDHMLDRLVEAGITRAVVNVHHHADLLEAHLEGRSAPQIVISDERGQLLETGGGLVRARPQLGDGAVMIANIDSVWLENRGAPKALDGLMARWDPAAMDALLLMAATPHSLGYDGRGDFDLDHHGRARRRKSGRIAPFAYTGVQIFTLSLLDGFAEEPFSLNLAWNKALEADRLYGQRLDGFWMHVGDPIARLDAEEQIARAGHFAA